MNHTDLQMLLNRGRRAGLNTAEIYSALSTHRPTADEMTNGRTDSNGYTARYTEQGQRVYQPLPKAG